MKSITLNVYEFSELSEKAKERAKNDSAGFFGYMNSADALESLSALAAHFDGTLKDYSIDFFACSPSSAKFEMPEMSQREIAARLAKLGSYNRKTARWNGDCVLTGYCMDEDAIDGFRAAVKNGGNDLNEFMQAAFRSWLKSVQADAEDQYTDATFGDFADANEYMYFESGELAHK